MPLYVALKKQSFRVPPEHRWSVFWICLWYSLASTFVFGAFSLILPDAAVAGRSASRTICSVIFTLVVLHEKLTILEVASLALSVGGIAFMGPAGNLNFGTYATANQNTRISNAIQEFVF